MKNIKMPWQFGTFDSIAADAVKMVTPKKNVEFDFNGVLCVVSKTTDLKLLWRDYQTSHYLGWETIGPDCVDEYSSEILQKIASGKAEEVERSRIRHEEYQREMDLKKSDLMKKISNINLHCDQEKWNKWQLSNQDGYGQGILRFADNWGRLMQYEIGNGAKLEDIANKTSHDADIEGITGFMYGAAVSILSDCWQFGEDLRKWHNKEYNHEGDGVVNPAVITI